jgi:hypothetical protein
VSLFTPEPWFLAPDFSAWQGPACWYATVQSGPFADLGVGFVRAAGRTPEEAAANAVLIAQAPALKEAVAGLLDLVGELAGGGEIDDPRLEAARLVSQEAEFILE